MSDITLVGEFSPETFEAEWLGGALGPEVGAMCRRVAMGGGDSSNTAQRGLD